MPPITIMIKPVSGRCDMRCRYCFYADELQYRQEGAGQTMALETLETAVRRVLRSAEHAAQFVFQGGEPTLAGLGFFEALLAFQRKYNGQNLPITNCVQTNGLSLSDALISFFAREKFLVGVSLDGTAAVHDRFRKDGRGAGTWERVRANLDKLRKAGAECNVLCVVTRAAAAQAEAVFSALAPYGWLQFIPCLDPLDGREEDYSLPAPLYGEFLCKTFDLYEAAWRGGTPVSVRTFDNWIGMLLGRAPENCAMAGRCGSSLMLESDGSLYPCDFYGTDSWRLGNILHSSYKKILLSPLEQSFIAASLPVPEKCRPCPWYPLCRNGCRREREGCVSRWCEAHILFFEYAFPRLKAMARAISREANSAAL